MRIDAANARLRELAPVMRDHGVDYERGKMKEKLESGVITLKHAEEWLGNFHDKETVSSAFNHAMVDLVIREEPLSKEHWPETLIMDFKRISDYRNLFKHVVESTTFLALIASKVSQDNLARIAALLGKGVQDIAETVKTVFGEDSKIVVAMEQSFDTRNPVHTLIRKRVIQAMMTGDIKMFKEYSLTIVKGLVDKMRRLIKINGMVHGDIYTVMYDSANSSASTSSSQAEGGV
jgi:hypothetical protein